MRSLEQVELDVTKAVAGSWRAQVEAVKKRLIVAHSTKGELTDAEVRAALRGLTVSPAALNAAKALLPAALVGDARVEGKTAVHLGAKPKAVLAAARRKPAAAVKEATRRIGVVPLSTLVGVLAVLGPLTKSAAEMEGAASYAVHLAANEAATSAAEQTGAKLVFVAERDACLECNGYAGATGDDIPEVPVHPNCRCELQPYDDPAIPVALKREALRSVLRGFSLPSESEAARVRAAKAALRSRPNAPQSVKDYAAAAVKRGKFPRGRSVPGS